MERNRESSRRITSTAAAGISSSSRRPRTRDVSDDEDRMEDVPEPRAWERPRKDRLPTIHVSTANARNKRRRQQESQASGRVMVSADDAEESAEDTDMAPSEDDDEPPPPPPILRRPLKPRTHAKEDEIVMDIPPVPRKARSSISSSSRFASMPKRQQESAPNDLNRNKSPGQTQAMLNGSSSPGVLPKVGKGQQKPVVTKFRATKVCKVSESPAISDQEAEVAEALFVLATSSPAGLMEPRLEARHEAAGQTSSSPTSTGICPPGNPQHAGSTSNGHGRDTLKPTAEAPRRKQPRVVTKHEEGKPSSSTQLSVSREASTVGLPVVKTESEASLSQNLPTDAMCVSAELPKTIDGSNSIHPQLLSHDGLKTDNEGMDQTEPKVVVVKENMENDATNLSELGDQQSLCSDTLIGTENIQKIDATNVPGAVEADQPNRPVDTLHDNNGECPVSKIDLMRTVESDASGAPKASSLLTLETHVHSTNRNTEIADCSRDEPCKENMAETEVLNLKERSNARKQQESSSQENHLRTSQVLKGTKEENESSRTCSKSQKADAAPSPANCSATAALGWISGLSQMGYYGPGSAAWGASMPSSNDFVKTAPPTMLPHAAILPPLPRMKRCATHVYVARFIHYMQQVSRHSLWSAALCRTPCNLNIPPVNIHDNEKLGTYVDVTRKTLSQQSESSYGYSISQSGTPGTVGGSGATTTAMISATSTSTNTVNVENGNRTTVSNVMAAHAHQYLQAMMQQNGIPSFPFPFTGQPSQAAQFFNGPFFPAHIMPPLPQLQALGQQAATTGMPVQKQQQGTHQQSSSNQHGGTQQQLQLQLAPQSPSFPHQQHSHMNSSVSHFGSHVERENTAGGEPLSAAESRLSAMSKSSCDQPPNLPNLNMSPVLIANVPSMNSLDRDASSTATAGGKQNTKSQQQPQFQSQGQRLSMPQQYMQPNSGSAPGLQMNNLSQGYSPIAISGTSRGMTGSMGLVSVSPMMTAQGHGLLSESPENTRIHVQQQQVYGSHNPQHQRVVMQAATPHDETDQERKAPGKQLGSFTHTSRVELEGTSAVQGSPTGGNVGSTGRPNSNLGQPITSVMVPDNRNTKPLPSGTIGSQVPVIQSQQTKLSTSRTKVTSATSSGRSISNMQNVYGYIEKPLNGNSGKYAVAYVSQSASPSQGSKQNHAGAVKSGQRMSPVPVQQAATHSSMTKVQQNQSNQQQGVSTPLKLAPAVSLPAIPSGTLPVGTPLLSAPKSATGTTSKTPSNGKVITSAIKSAPTVKKPSSSGALSGPMQSLSSKATATTQQKSQATVAHMAQFSQQQVLVPRVASKSQVYPQPHSHQVQDKQTIQQQPPYRPQLFVPQHQQYMQSSSSSSTSQQQPQHSQPVAQHYRQLPGQHAQAQQMRQDSHSLHIQSVPSQLPTKAMSLSSSNLTLGTSIVGNINSDATSDGSEQFRGSSGRMNSSKVVYSSGGQLLAAGSLPEMITAAHPAVSGQIGQHSSNLPYLQPAAMKSVEQKPSSDMNREEMSSAPQVPVALNPLS